MGTKPTEVQEVVTHYLMEVNGALPSNVTILKQQRGKAQTCGKIMTLKNREKKAFLYPVCS